MGIPLRVLLVEDSLADAELELAELRLGGYDLDYKRVDKPEEMKAALKEQEWDIILSDYIMPRFNGPAALNLLKDSGLDIPFIMVTGQVGEATAIETLTAGAHDYVMKGNLARLVPAVQRVLQDAVLRRERREAEEALRKAHEELRLAHADLERRVEERTAELAKVNEELENENVERKQAEEEVRRVAAFNEAAMKNLGEGLYTIDENGLVTFMNPASEQLLGWSFAELHGKKMHDMTHHHYPDGRSFPSSECAGFQVLTHGRQLVNREDVFIRKDGTFFPVTYSISPMRDDTGRITGLVVVFRDVTERERLLEEVDAQRRLLQSVVQNAPVGIAVLRGPSFIFELVNPAYQAITPGKVLVGRTVAESWPELASQVVALLEQVYHTGEPYRTVDSPYPVQRSPGGPLEEVYFTFAYIPLRRPDDQIDAILVLVIETTEQVTARQRVGQLARDAQRRSAELQSIIDNMADGVFVSDAEGHITLVNGAGIKMLGMGRPEEAKRMLEEFPELLRMRHLDGSPVGPEELPLGRALKGETVVQHDEIIFDRKTQRDTYLRSSAAPIRDGEGKIVGAVALTRDVTELMELDRLKDQFIEVAAHELKTPVTGIKGFAQFLLQREHEGVSPVGLRALEAINRQSDRISRLVNELLETSRIQTEHLELHPTRFDLSQLAAETVETMKIATEKHKLLFRSPGPVLVDADRERIGEVLSTLLDNAIRYSPQGGDIETTVRVVDEEAVVSVQDHGVGIPKDKQSRIFERFYRAHTGTPYDYGGMGIALFISKEIVERHGGRMWFESRVPSGRGKGSTFYFSLPLA